MGSKSKQSAARLGDIDTGHPPSPPTPIVTASTNVFTNGRPAARKGDMLIPHHPGIRTITEGASTVKINGKPAARVTDGINCGGKIIVGSGNVKIGDKPEAPRNAKTSMEFAAIIDAGFEPENQNLSPHQQTEIEAAIAVKYNPTKGAAPVWHEHYMSNEPEPGSVLSSVQKSGLQKSQAEKAKQAAENIADAKDMAEQVNQKELNELGSSMITASETIAKDEYASDEIKSIAASMLSLAGGNDKPKNAGSKKSQQNNNKLDESIKQKQVNPQSFDQARGILKNRRDQIQSDGYQSKYNDTELQELAKNGDVGEERFQVRLMEKNYLQDRDTPDIPLSGKLGAVMEGENGKGAKYWSTSFDQIEDADSDPRLLCGKLGLEYDPEKEYALIIIDNEKAVPLTGVKSVPATFEKVGGFANDELPLDFPTSFTEAAMTTEFQDTYSEHYKAAVDSGDLPNKWSKDTKRFQNYLDTQNLTTKDQENLIQRMKMHNKVGNNQDYTGNGLTKNIVEGSPNEHGAVETLNFERKEVTLSKLDQENAITLIQDLKTT